MAFYSIILDNNPFQNWNVTLPFRDGNKKFKVKLTYNTIGEFWYMTIFDFFTDAVLIDGIPLFDSDFPTADLFKPYSYRNTGKLFLVKLNDDYVLEDRANEENLGTDYQMVWTDDE